MNVIAAAPGWRNLAVWAMPPVACALASDTLIGVVRSWVIARHKHLNAALAAEEVTPLAVVGGLLLWLLRLSLAPASTLTGFRAWALDECPVAPGRRAANPAPAAATASPPAISPPRRRGRGRRRGDTKSARFLALVWPHIEGWAAELGLTAPDALAWASQSPGRVTIEKDAVVPEDPEAAGS